MVEGMFIFKFITSIRTLIYLVSLLILFLYSARFGYGAETSLIKSSCKYKCLL